MLSQVGRPLTRTDEYQRCRKHHKNYRWPFVLDAESRPNEDRQPTVSLVCQGHNVNPVIKTQPHQGQLHCLYSIYTTQEIHPVSQSLDPQQLMQLSLSHPIFSTLRVAVFARPVWTHRLTQESNLSQCLDLPWHHPSLVTAAFDRIGCFSFQSPAKQRYKGVC